MNSNYKPKLLNWKREEKEEEMLRLGGFA